MLNSLSIDHLRISAFCISDLNVGKRSNNPKFSTHHQDQSMEILATREGEDECIFICLKIVMRKRYKNAVGGVVHAVIQIAVDSDLSTERTAPPRSTHVQPGDVSSFLILQGKRRS